MEDPWAYYKEILKHHFLTEDKTLKDVQKFMNDTYNFRARYTSVLRLRRLRTAKFVDSKAQYENRFMKWGFRKHRKGHEWKDASYRIEKRKRDGKDSSLYIDGALIPKKKICKEASRHNFPTIQERYGQGKISQYFSMRILNCCSKSENTGRILYLHTSCLFSEQLSVKQLALVPVPDHY